MPVNTAAPEPGTLHKTHRAVYRRKTGRRRANRPCITAGLCLEAVHMHWMCCARIRASQHSCARSAAGCVLRGENAALRAGAGVEHRYLPRASTRRSDARQEARGTSPSYPACPMVQGAESGCWTALPRVAKPSRGCRMVRRASHREHAETARPAVGTAQAGCLACTHRRPGRRPRPPRGGRDCRIAREGMGLVFLCFWLAPKKSISTRRWIPTRCERVWYSK